MKLKGLTVQDVMLNLRNLKGELKPVSYVKMYGGTWFGIRCVEQADLSCIHMEPAMKFAPRRLYADDGELYIVFPLTIAVAAVNAQLANLTAEEYSEICDQIVDRAKWNDLKKLLMDNVRYENNGNPYPVLENGDEGRVKVMWKDERIASIIPHIADDGRVLFDDDTKDCEILAYPDSDHTITGNILDICDLLSKFQKFNGDWTAAILSQ